MYESRENDGNSSQAYSETCQTPKMKFLLVFLETIVMQILLLYDTSMISSEFSI